MQKIIIDLPDLNRRVNLPSDQWKNFRQWLEEHKVEYEEEEPAEASVDTDSSTALVFRIKDQNNRVSEFLESHSGEA